jgi:opacity protein-like surface antigen
LFRSTESVKADNSIAFLYGPGIQYAVTDNLKIFFEADYRYSNTGEGSSLDSWGWGYSSGVRWYF